MNARAVSAVRAGPAVFRVQRLNNAHPKGLLSAGWISIPIALGQNGSRWRKSEGDLATPIGVWFVEAVYWRSDRVKRWQLVPAGLPGRALKTTDGWCDTPSDRNYNRWVRLPYEAGSEALWRDPPVYDVIFVLSHNRLPRVRGHGSAVFLHLAEEVSDRDDLKPTAGCIALRRRDLARLRPHIRRGMRIHIKG